MSRCRSPSRKWRSPKEVLYIREDKDSRRRLDPSKPLMSAFDSLTQENIELKALVEILKAKNKADSSKHLALGIKAQEQEVKIEENYKLITRLQRDLKNCNSDVVNLSAQLEHKRKLFITLQDSLQNSVNECLELRHLLEGSHLETAALQKKTSAEIEHLEDRLTLLSSRTSTAERKCALAEAALKEAQADFRFRGTRNSIGLLYMSCLGVYKRIMGRSLHQWRACTTAAVALDAQVKIDAKYREAQREAHSTAVAVLNNQHAETKLEMNETIRYLKDSKDELRDKIIQIKSKNIWGNNVSMQNTVFGLWKCALQNKVIHERNDLKGIVSNIQDQLKIKKAELRDKCQEFNDVQASVNELLIKDSYQKAVDMLIRLAANRLCRQEKLKRAYSHWCNKVLFQKKMESTHNEVMRISSNSMALEKKFQLTVQKYRQCHQHNKKLNRKIDAYRNITSSIATVMRYHSIIYRCFSSWKQYSFEAKIKRVGTWPELWRLSKLTPDANKKFGDIMHESDMQKDHNMGHVATPAGGFSTHDPRHKFDDSKSVLTNSSMSTSTTSSPQMLLHQYRKGKTSHFNDKSDNNSMSTVSDLGKSGTHSVCSTAEISKRLQLEESSPTSEEYEPIRQLQYQSRRDQLQHNKPLNLSGRTCADSVSSRGSGTSARKKREKMPATAVNLQDLLLSKGNQSQNMPNVTPGVNIDFLEGAIDEDIDFDDYYDSQQMQNQNSYNDEYDDDEDRSDDEDRNNDGKNDLDVLDIDGEDQLSEALDMESSYGTHRTQLTSTGGSYSGGSLAFSGTLGSYKLSHSGGFSATGDFSNAVALNPTPSQEYLHLLSPRKKSILDSSDLGFSESIGSEDQRTRENTRSNRQGSLKSVEEDGRKGVVTSQVQSSLTFDSNTHELKLDDVLENGSGEHHDNDEDSLNFNVTETISGNDEMLSPAAETGDYSHALSLFSPK